MLSTEVDPSPFDLMTAVIRFIFNLETQFFSPLVWKWLIPASRANATMPSPILSKGYLKAQRLPTFRQMVTELEEELA